MYVCFFFQAEDGIRDSSVTGVQTCALPICGSRVRRSGARVDSSCLTITLNWDFAKMRSNSLSTKGCGERMQTVNFVEVRFVVTVRQSIENWPKGQVLWWFCSRTVTDSYDACPRGTSFNKISTMRLAAWPSHRGGMRPALPLPARVSRAAATILRASVPTSRFVPWELAVGRSVLSRRVRQGMPKAVGSSWMLPE